jgi:hypothetical protein
MALFSSPEAFEYDECGEHIYHGRWVGAQEAIYLDKVRSGILLPKAWQPLAPRRFLKTSPGSPQAQKM